MRRGILAVLVVAALATACTSVVEGTGSGAGGSRPTGDFPTPTGTAAPPTPTGGFPAPTGTASAPAPTGTARTPAPTASGGPISVTCPTIVFPPAHLRFACIDDDLTIGADDAVWPLNLVKPVEPSWQLAEGAGHWGSAKGHSLAAIARNVRQQMLDTNAYGPDPAVKTLASKQMQVAGTAGWVLQTEFTISPAYRTQKSLKVKVERSWIVAVTVGDDDVSLWYVTLPDDVKQLWSKVDDVIGTIRVV
jgi:hypothetical protein